MKVSHVEKNMVEQSSTVPNTLKLYLNHTLGLTLSTPGLVISSRLKAIRITLILSDLCQNAETINICKTLCLPF